MGLFDKLNDVAKKATGVAETYAKKAQETISGTVKPNSEIAAVSTEQQGPTYYPQTQDISGLISIDNSLLQANEEQTPWEQVTGVARTFPIADKTLEVPANLDIFNTYRLRFRELAIKYADTAEQEYNAKVNDFITFMENFPQIYNLNLHPLIKRAVDVLIAEGIWTVTYESFLLGHKEKYKFAIEDYETMTNSTNLTLEANQQIAAGVTSLATDFLGGQLGKIGLGGDIGASFIGGVKDGMVEGAAKNTGISPEQQAELYQRINSTSLFEHVYADYMCVCSSLVLTLIQNGQDIWCPNPELNQQASNIFQNLSNPNFPQDKVLDAFLGILKTNPYNIEYHKFIISRLGETEEVKAIKDYFGYTDLNNPRIS